MGPLLLFALILVQVSLAVSMGRNIETRRVLRTLRDMDCDKFSLDTVDKGDLGIPENMKDAAKTLIKAGSVLTVSHIYTELYDKKRKWWEYLKDLV